MSAIALPPGVPLERGMQVAANVPSGADEGTSSWILATVEGTLPESRSVIVTDDDASAGVVRHTLPLRNVLPLPTALPEIWTPRHEFGHGSSVLALWPEQGSTCFYPAVVRDPPSTRVRRRGRAQRRASAERARPTAGGHICRAFGLIYIPVGSLLPVRPRVPTCPACQAERDYTLVFADDHDSHGRPKLRHVPPRFVVQAVADC